MATNPLDMTQQENSLLGFFQAMGLPAPANYQPNTDALASIMSGYGGFNPGSAAPNFPDAPEPANTTPTPTDGSLAPPDPQGTFGQIGLPIPAGQDPGSWDFWGQSADALAPMTNFLNIMSPFLDRLQNERERTEDFSEANRRWERQQDWTEYLDVWNQALQSRQQNTAERDRALSAQQWLESFNRQGQNDAFSQGMSIQNLLLNLARLQEQQRAANLQAFGRGAAPGRWSSSWG